ncbi:MAG: hypothetical protein R3310_12835, partial [Candidatus Competibacteraceae bacterium]|nr:hypothetical protein [Candidatus Competibacteraceae bacterium]
MTETRRILTGLALGALAMLSTQMMPARAAVMVDASVTDQVGGVFNYAFSVTNDLDDLAIVEIDAPLGDALITATLSYPAAYLADYGPGLGALCFLPSFFFENGTVGPLTFDSNAP